MADVGSTAAPVALLGGVSLMSIFAGADTSTAVMAFAGALLFAFVAQDTKPLARVLGLISSWIFGYYVGMEIVRRGWFGFDSPPLPAFVSAFFCVAVFKLLLAIFAEDGKAWIRKKLGLSSEGSKRE